MKNKISKTHNLLISSTNKRYVYLGVIDSDKEVEITVSTFGSKSMVFDLDKNGALAIIDHLKKTIRIMKSLTEDQKVNILCLCILFIIVPIVGCFLASFPAKMDHQLTKPVLEKRWPQPMNNPLSEQMHQQAGRIPETDSIRMYQANGDSITIKISNPK